MQEPMMLSTMLAVWLSRVKSLGMEAFTASLKSLLWKNCSSSRWFSRAHSLMSCVRLLVWVVCCTHRASTSPSF